MVTFGVTSIFGVTLTKPWGYLDQPSCKTESLEDRSPVGGVTCWSMNMFTETPASQPDLALSGTDRQNLFTVIDDCCFASQPTVDLSCLGNLGSWEQCLMTQTGHLSFQHQNLVHHCHFLLTWKLCVNQRGRELQVKFKVHSRTSFDFKLSLDDHDLEARKLSVALEKWTLCSGLVVRHGLRISTWTKWDPMTGLLRCRSCLEAAVPVPNLKGKLQFWSFFIGTNRSTSLYALPRCNIKSF